MVGTQFAFVGTVSRAARCSGGLPDNSVITIEVSSWRGLHPRNCAHTSRLRVLREDGESGVVREGLPLNRGSEMRIEGKYDGGYEGAAETRRRSLHSYRRLVA